jgi:hypothetical protein
VGQSVTHPNITVLKVNDPAYAIPKEMTIDRFNERLARDTTSPVMYMPRV